MDEKTLHALTALAQKLGTTAEYLWGVLLKQAPITGIVDLLTSAALFAGAWLWLRYVMQKTTEPKEIAGTRWERADWDNEAAFFSWLSAIVLVAIASVLLVSSVSTIITVMLNPEYWALRQILK